jgi:hypothetical protein
MVAACFDDLDTLETAFGTGAAIVLSPLILAGSLVSYLQSQLNAGFGQRNDRDRYRITISRREELPVLKDDRLGPLVIGMSLDSALATGWVGEEMVACEVSLGIATSDEARTFLLGGPSAPPGLDGSVDFFQG